MWKLFALATFSYAATLTYNWNVTWVSVTPDGFRRPAIGINGEWPCPTIRGNVGDQVVLNLNNQLGNETTSLHFHGIPQTGTNNMDGPAQVSQCAIPGDGSSFTYRFTLECPGTYWYHSHVSGQYPDGLRGPLIVEDPNDPYAGHYSEEIVMTFSDWYHEQAPVLINKMISPSNPGGAPPTVDSALINDSANPVMLNFEPGKTYKIRVINMAALASAMLQFEGHTMGIVEIDGVYTSLHEARQIRVAPAQRYSFLVTAERIPRKNYAFLMSLDVNRDYTTPGATYDLNVTGQLYSSNIGLATPLSVKSWDPIDDTTLLPLDLHLAHATVSDVLTMNVSLGTDNMGVPRAFVNGQTYISQKVPTLYTALTTESDASNPLVYGLVNPFVVQENQVVEIVLNNLNAEIHPFHLHGHKFQTMARPPSNSGVFNGKTQGFPLIPMRRDTVHVFANSYLVLRFVADNPGIQLFHCHIEWHVDMGMVATIVESPSTLQNTLSIPTDQMAVCKAQEIPTAGNAAGNTEDFLDLTGANTSPPYPDNGALSG